MAIGYFRPDGGAFVAELGAAHREALVSVVDQVVDLLGGAGAADVDPFALTTGPVAPPVDPAVRRLLPDASRADPEVAAEFRRLTDAELRGTKVTQLLRLRTVLADGDALVTVPAADAPAVAAALTDARLVLADRLGLRTDADAETLEAVLEAAERQAADDDAPVPFVVVLAAVYDLLGLLQATLVDRLLDALDDGPPTDPVPPSR